MMNNIKPESNGMVNVSERRLAEINYHRRLNTRMVLFALPIFMFFTLFHCYLDHYFQSLIFLLLSSNAMITLVLGSKINALKNLLLMRQIGATIAFGLLAISLITGLLSDDVYIFFPWIYFYPIISIIFFGGRPGLICALLFSVTTVGIVILLDLPEWNVWNIKMFKLNSAFALLSMLGLGFISEKSRVHMRNELLDARNRYKSAEERQRETNLELKNEIELRVQSEKALAQSEIHYRTLFEESTVSLWEENWSKVKAYLEGLPAEALSGIDSYFSNNPKQKEYCFHRIQLISVNRATLDLFEAYSEKILINSIQKILPVGNIDWIAERIVALYNTGHYDGEISVKTLNGNLLHVLVKSAVVSGYESSWEKVYTSVYDITEKVAIEQEKRRVEKQIQHTRQIQSIASLAGGISQQFNNSLAVIYGNLDLLEHNIHSGIKTSAYIKAMKEASDHMSSLTDQLLAYAQGGKYQPKDSSANELIQELLDTSKIKREFSIPILTRFNPDVFLASSDITQIKMVLEAVITNAVESIKDKGEVTVSTQNKVISEGNVETDLGLKSGKYALITIVDQGIGMDENAQSYV